MNHLVADPFGPARGFDCRRLFVGPAGGREVMEVVKVHGGE